MLVRSLSNSASLVSNACGQNSAAWTSGYAHNPNAIAFGRKQLDYVCVLHDKRPVESSELGHVQLVSCHRPSIQSQIKGLRAGKLDQRRLWLEIKRSKPFHPGVGIQKAVSHYLKLHSAILW